MRYILFFTITTALTFLFSFRLTMELEVPPGTVSITDSLFIDETEIRNIDWKEYVYWNKQTHGSNSPQYLRSLPDTSVWGTGFDAYKTHYFRNSKFNEFPVVGISFEQAKAYCKWRTERVIEFMMIQENTSDIKQLPYIRYRLPSEKEWKKVASSGYAKKYYRKADKKFDGKFPFNFSRSKSPITDKVSVSELQYYSTMPSSGGFPNNYGCYNMEGNVAEMIHNKGKAKGGSFLHLRPVNLSDTVYTYEEPANWLGFRCVCDFFPRK